MHFQCGKIFVLERAPSGWMRHLQISVDLTFAVDCVEKLVRSIALQSLPPSDGNGTGVELVKFTDGTTNTCALQFHTPWFVFCVLPSIFG